MNKKLDIHQNTKWRIADDGPPENPLQSLTTSISSSSKDFSDNQYDAFLYAICVGWEDGSYAELKDKFGWSDKTIAYQKKLHQNYIKAWNLLTENGIR
jgi:hypothetical protein